MPRTLAGEMIVMCLLLTIAGAQAQTARVLQPGFGQRATWTVAADKPWWGLVDLRDMLCLFHPYSLSQTGATAGATATLTIPATWKPPFALRFTCADDYFADPATKPGTVGAECFFEHRFKQVLVDGKVVWEQDVIDENTMGSPTSFTVDLTPHVTPGKRFTLCFRVLDKVASSERNPRDVWFIGGTWYAAGDGKTEQEPRFHTAVWYADPVIGETAAVAATPAGHRPHEAIVAARHKARWPLAPLTEPLQSPAAMTLVSPAAIPAGGFPLTCGLPMSPGLLRDAKRVRLVGPTGNNLPVQTATTGLWPDGSVRWLLVNAALPPGTPPQAKLKLVLNEPPVRPAPTPLKVRRTGDAVTVDTGAVQIALGQDHSRLVDEVRLTGQTQPVLSALAPRLSVRLAGKDTAVQAAWDKLQVVESGPVRACVELTGTLKTETKPLGRFLFRLYATAGLPTVQTRFRVFNEVKPEPYNGTIDDAPLEVTDLALVAQLPGTPRERNLGGDGGKWVLGGNGDATLVQPTADAFSATCGGGDSIAIPGKRAQGWISSTGDNGTVQASVWRFWQQFPKSLAARGNGLEIGLFTPTKDFPAYKPRFGEAKAHDVCLTFSKAPLMKEESQTLSLLANEPPRLFDANWFCRSGGIALLDPQWFAHQPQLGEAMVEQYGDFSSDRFPGHFGIRDFGDMPYRGPQWLNGYWAMVQGTLNWGLASGEQQWLERSFEIARHIADVDAVHLPPGHPDWNEWDGQTCALAPDHSVHDGLSRWAAFQIGESLMLHHWMTGDPDSRAAALANADYIIRNDAGLGSSEARSQARPMLTLLRAWEATGDVKYRDAAKRYLDLTYQIEKCIEWRRGAYIQPTYANWRCISAGLDSMYAQNIYEYYRLTGDAQAAQLIVAIADSVYSESMLPQEEGLGSFIFYVRYSRASWYYTQMAILFHQAYDLTDDLRFLRAGRAAFARYLLCQDGNGKPWYQPIHNFGWLDPEFGGWALHFQNVKTEPFHITTQTPVPDPSNY